MRPAFLPRIDRSRTHFVGTQFAVALLLALSSLTLGRAAAAPAANSPQTLSLREYISELDRCSAALANIRTDPAALRNLQQSIPKQWNIQADRQSYVVDTDWLAGSLAEAMADHKDQNAVREAQSEIAAHRDAAQALERSGRVRDLGESRNKLNEILAAKEFQEIHGPTWLDSLRARIYDWIVRELEKLFGRIGHGRVIGNVIAWTVIALTTLLLLLWVVRSTIGSAPGPGMDLRGAGAAGQDSSYWLREARAAAARGEYRAAIHAGYWAGIARLEETKLLTEDRSRTPRESLRLIRRESAEYPPLSQLTRRFELVWYGYRSADPADWDDAVQQLEKLGCLRSSTPAISAS